MNVEIREIQNDDCSAVCSLINSELGYPDVSERELSHRLNLMRKQGNHFVFIAAVNSEVVGFIGVVREIAFEFDGDYLRITALAVSKNYQGKGVGSALLERIEELAKENKISLIALNSGLNRLESHKFYENSGYSKKSYGFTKRISG